MLRSAFVGAAIALVLVAGVVGLALTHTGPFAAPPDSAGSGPVVVALVLRGTDGVEVVRTIDVAQATPSGWTLRSVSPSVTVDVPGTQADTVADAYTFGGARGLTQAVQTTTKLTPTAWVVVDDSAWNALLGGSVMAVRIPEDVEVFDGARLYSFAASETTLPAAMAPQLLEGATFLPAAQDRVVRTYVGDALASALASASVGQLGDVGSSMSRTGLETWAAQLRNATRVNGP